MTPPATRERLLQAIAEFIDHNGFSPTVRELGDLADIRSLSTVHAHLQRLAREGRITWTPQQPRTIRPSTPTAEEAPLSP